MLPIPVDLQPFVEEVITKLGPYEVEVAQVFTLSSPTDGSVNSKMHREIYGTARVQRERLRWESEKAVFVAALQDPKAYILAQIADLDVHLTRLDVIQTKLDEPATI